MGQQQQFAPGMRLEIRDDEWCPTRHVHARDGGYLLTSIGLSELVSVREASFLSQSGDEIRIHQGDLASTNSRSSTACNFRRCASTTSLLGMTPMAASPAPSQDFTGVSLQRKADRKKLDSGIHYSIESADRKVYGIVSNWEGLRA